MNKDGDSLKRGLRRLKRYQSLSLEAKIKYAMRLIEVGLALAEKPLVTWSGGKDSGVVLDLVRRLHPDVAVVYNDTGVEFPETRRFVQRMTKEWSLNLHIARPEKGKGFWWCVKQFGWPLMGKAFTRKRTNFHSEKQRKVMTSGARLSPSCCWYCKEKPAKALYNNLGADLVFLGIMASESDLRKRNWCDYGDFHWNKKERRWKVHPISVWTEEDIWQYHSRFNLPMCELYAMGHRRNGCFPCGMDLSFPDNHLAMLRRSHPKLWRFLIVDKGLGQELLKIKLALSDGQADLFSTTWPIKELIEQRPCFFDRL